MASKHLRRLLTAPRSLGWAGRWPRLISFSSKLNRDNHRFLHNLAGFEPPDIFGCREDIDETHQQEIVSRLLDYYFRLKSSAEMNSAKLDMWTEISKRHAGFIAALERRDAQAVSDSLLNVCNSPLVMGFENNSLGGEDHTRFLKLNVVDKFLALAESLGVVTVQCPEQGPWGRQDFPVDEILAGIRDNVPFDIAAPKAGGGSFGLRTEIGILTERNLQAISSALRVERLLEGRTRKSVAEIGGGLGALTFYISKCGAEHVSLFDLPIVSILQGYFLMKSLGPAQVHLWGESGDSAARVRVLPGWALPSTPDGEFTLVINQDSLPEIDRDVALNYLELIRAKAIDYFVSINQESRAPNGDHGQQSVVFELIDEVGGYRRLSREKDWMREGYVAETYRVCGGARGEA